MGNTSNSLAPSQGTVDPYLTAQTHLALEQSPWQIRKHLSLPSVQAYRATLPQGGTGYAGQPSPISGVREGDTRAIQYYQPHAFSTGDEATDRDHASQIGAHEAMHLIQNMMPAEMTNKFPAINEKDPYADMRLTAANLVKARASGDTLWDHSREGQASIIQKYQARQNWMNAPTTSPADRSAYMNSTGDFKGSGNAEWQKAYGPYLDDVGSLKLPGDASMPTTPVQGPSLLPVLHAVHLLSGHPSQDGQIPGQWEVQPMQAAPVPPDRWQVQSAGAPTAASRWEVQPPSSAPGGIDMPHVWGATPGMGTADSSSALQLHPMSIAAALTGNPDPRDAAKAPVEMYDYGQRGLRQAATGLHELTVSGQREQGLTDVLSGAGNTLGSTMVGPGVEPGIVAKGLAGSMAGSYAAPKAVKALGGDEQDQRLAMAAGGFLPLLAGVGAGYLKGDGPGRLVDEPESTSTASKELPAPSAPPTTELARWTPSSPEAQATISAQGDELPPQTATAGPMSPEAERISAQAASPHPLDQKIAAVEPGFEPTPEEVQAQEAQIIKSTAVPGFENLSDTDRAEAARISLKRQDAQNAITIHSMDSSGVPELQMAAHAQAANANPRVANWVRHLAGEDTSLNSPASLLPSGNTVAPPDISSSGEPAVRSAGTTQPNPIAAYRLDNPDLTAKEAEMKPVLNKIARINTFLRSDNPDYSAANTEGVTGRVMERLIPEHLTKTEAARLQELTGRRTKTNGTSSPASSAPVAASPIDAKTATKQYLEDNDLKPAFQKEIQRKFRIAYPKMSPSEPDYGVLLNNYAKQNWFPIAKDLVEQHQAMQGPKPETNPDELRELLGEGQLTAKTRQEVGISQRSESERQEISNLRKKLIAKEGQKLTSLVRTKYMPDWKQELARGGNSSFNEQSLDGLPTRLKNELLKEIPDATKPASTPTRQTIGRADIQKLAQAARSPKASATAIAGGPEKGLEVNQPNEGLNPRDETPPSVAKAVPSGDDDKTPPPSGGEPPRFDLNNTPFHDTMDGVNSLINAHPESERWLQPMLEASIRSHVKVADQVEAFRAGVKAYHAALDNDDPFALKVGMDAARPSSRFGSKPYTSEELKSINSSVAYARLTKLNSLAPLELASHKEDIWSENLQSLIDESGDPDLVQALKDLKARVPKSNSVTNTILGLFRDSLPKQQVDTLHSIIRSQSGRAYRTNLVLQQHLNAFDSLLNNLSRAESLRFIARMESGEAQVSSVFRELDPKTQTQWMSKYKETALPEPDAVAGELRRLLDLYKDNVNRASGALENFYTNYMPHIFENYTKAQAFAKQWVAKTPLEGTTSYLRQRHYAFLEDAVMAGNMPLTFNPVRLATMRMEQMGRFAMAHDIRNQMIDGQLARPFKMNDQKPDGWVALEDKLFAIKQFVPEQGGIINRGQYYAPEAVAKDFNEFVKNGATGGWVIPHTNLSLYDTFRGWSGLANRFQLSLSVLHGMETTLNAGASELGDALVRGSYGDYAGAAKSVLNWASIFGPVIRNTYYGNHIIANFQDPDKAIAYAQVSSAAEAAGVRLNLDPFFETHELEKMKLNWGKVTSDLPLSNKVAPLFKLPLNLAGAAIEKTTWPLMNWFVPRAKLGAFAMEMKRVQDLNPGASQEFLNREAEKAWDSMDDRFGEFVNSNWFVPQVTKDVLNLAFRSPGWNVGTARQGFGGLRDLAAALKDAPSNKGRVRLSSRTAFMLALPLTVAYLNSLYQKLHTNTFPASPMDYFFPQTGTKNRDGEPNRVMPKSYVGDVINFYHDPTSSLFHKAAPEISTMSDIIRNSNYYGREVYDPASSRFTKLGQVALFAVQNSSTPFSLSNYSERKMRSPESQLFGQAGMESSLGYLPAPAWVGKTNAENLASQYYTMEHPQGIKDESEMDQKSTFVQFRQKALAGTITTDQITKAMNAGKLKPGQIRYLFRPQNQTALEYHTQGLTSMDRKMAIYQAATPEEKQKLLPILTRALATVGPEQQQKDMKILGLQ